MQESLGHKLRLLRAERGLSLREAARRAGVVKETISDIERGHTRPYDVTLAKLAHAYDVPLEDLLDESVLAVGKAQARQETGQPKYRLEIKPTGPVHVSQEDLEEHGIAVTDAELRVLNDSLEGYLSGEVHALVALESERIDWERIRRLTTYVVGSGMLSKEETEGVLEGIRAELVGATA